MGKQDQATTDVFVEGARQAPAPFQITTDGFAPYRTAIRDTFEDRTDFAMLIKVYRAAPEGERRYNPAEVSAVEVVPIMGRPDPERICTSVVERSNLSLRTAVSAQWDTQAGSPGQPTIALRTAISAVSIIPLRFTRFNPRAPTLQVLRPRTVICQAFV